MAFNKEKLKKYATISLIAVPIAVLCFIWSKVIFGHFVFYDGDIFLNYYPYFRYFALGGDLVTQYILSGFPVFVTVSGIWFYPLNKIALLFLDPLSAYTAMTVFNMILAYGFAYAYARKIRFGHLTAVFVALIYLFSGQIMQWSQTLLMTNYYFILPGALFFFECALAQKKIFGRTAFLGLMGVILGIGWLSGQVQFVVYIHVCVVLYMMYRLFLEKGIRRIASSASHVVFPCLVSLAVGIPQILAILGFQHETARQAGVSLSDFFIGSYLPPDLMHYLLPFWSIPFVSLGSPNLYIGILPFLLLVFSFFLWRRISDRLFRFYAVAFAFCFLASIRYSPIGAILHELPIFDSFRVSSRIMFIGNFAAACMIGFCVEYCVSHKEEVSGMLSRYISILKKSLFYGLIPVFLIISLVKIFYFQGLDTRLDSYFLKHIYPHTAKMPVAYYDSIIQKSLQQVLGQFSFGNKDVIICIIFLLLSLWLLSRMHAMSGRKWIAACILLTAFNLAGVYYHHYPIVPETLVRSVPQTAQFIRERESTSTEPFRVFSVFPNETVFQQADVACGDTDPSETLILQKELLTPNSNMLYGLDSVDGYEPYMPASVARMTSLIGTEFTPTTDSLSTDPLTEAEKVQQMADRKNILRMMNVKYVVSSLEIKDEDFVPVFSTAAGACHTPVQIYELKGSWPRYFLSNNIEVSHYQNEDQLFEAVVGSVVGSDGAPNIMLDLPASSTLPDTIVKDGKPPQAVDPVYGYDTMTFRVDVDRGRVLYIGNTLLADWSASLDGAKADILQANNLYMAVLVPKGDHTIVLSYRKPANLISWIPRSL